MAQIKNATTLIVIALNRVKIFNNFTQYFDLQIIRAQKL